MNPYVVMAIGTPVLTVLSILLGYFLCYRSIATYTTSSRNALENMSSLNDILFSMAKANLKGPVIPVAASEYRPRTDEEEATIEGRIDALLGDLSPQERAQYEAQMRA